jgi:hypothetical protein
MSEEKRTKIAAGYQPTGNEQMKNNQYTSGYQPIGDGFKAQGVNMANLPRDGTGVPPKPRK